MLKGCKYCGRIHDSRFDCGHKPVRKYKCKRDDNAAQFRRSQRWKDKSIRVRERDHYLCQCCIRNFRGTVRRLNNSDLSVHHAIPVSEDYSRRLDDDNLVTLCAVHHEMAECGAISRDEILKIIQEQETKGTPRGGQGS